jgi:nucleoside recognition membrane protein YjiH
MMNAGKALIVVMAVGMAAVVAANARDIWRYLRIRSM